jgi:hypothetical protein
MLGDDINSETTQKHGGLHAGHTYCAEQKSLALGTVSSVQFLSMNPSKAVLLSQWMGTSHSDHNVVLG